MTSAIAAHLSAFFYPRTTEPALQDIDLTIDPGEFVVVTGQAGSGKTTLCYALVGAIPHFISGHLEGEVVLAGQRVADLRLPDASSLVGYVLQVPQNQLFNLTVEADVAFGPENLCIVPAEIHRRIETSLGRVGMLQHRQRFSDRLSGGQMQRVALATVLAMECPVLVLDQPCAELDPAGRREVYQQLATLNREFGQTIVLVDDKLSEVMEPASRVVVMAGGKIVADTTPHRLFALPELPSLGLRVPATVLLSQRLGEPVAITLREAAGRWRREGNGTNAEIGASPSIGSPAEAAVADTQAPPAAELRGVSFVYPTGVKALDDVSITFHRRTFSAVIGENGAGKTTLAKHLLGLLRPTSGQVLIDGQDIRKRTIAQVAAKVGYLFQDPDFQIFSDSVFAEVAFGLKLLKLSAAEIERRVTEVLAEVGLLELAQLHPYRLSRGQRQRLALASVLARDPELLVVDEPSTGLDHTETRQILDLLDRLAGAGKAVVAITHDVDLAMDYAQRAVVMHGARVQIDCPAPELWRHLERLTGMDVLLPENHQLARALNLPPEVLTIEEMAAAIEAARRPSGSEVPRER